MRSEKQLLLDEIKDQIDSSQAMVVTSYQKLNPNLAADFREEVQKSGGSFTVVKKRIFLKAAENAGLSFEKKDLEGHIGIVFAGDDTVGPTKAVYKFRNENEELLEVLGGRFEGKVCSPKEVEQISKLPSQDEMRAQFIGLLEAPLSQMVGVLNAVLTAVPYCLENKAKQEQ